MSLEKQLNINILRVTSHGRKGQLMERKNAIVLSCIFVLLVTLVVLGLLHEGCVNIDNKGHQDRIGTFERKKMYENLSPLEKKVVKQVETLSKMLIEKNSWCLYRPEYKEIIELGNAASDVLLSLLPDIKDGKVLYDPSCNHDIIFYLLLKIREPRAINALIPFLDCGRGEWGLAYSRICRFTGRKFATIEGPSETAEERELATKKIKKWWKENRSKYIKEK